MPGKEESDVKRKEENILKAAKGFSCPGASAQNGHGSRATPMVYAIGQKGQKAGFRRFGSQDQCGPRRVNENEYQPSDPWRFTKRVSIIDPGRSQLIGQS